MNQTKTVLTPTQFEDAKGRVWDLGLTFLEAERIDNSDFSDIWDRPFCFSLGPSSPDESDVKSFIAALQTGRMAMAIIWVIVQPQVKDQIGIDPAADAQSYDKAREEFIRGLNGAAVQRGKEALWESCQDFFQDQTTLLANTKTAMANAKSKVEQRLQTEFQDLDALIDQSMDREMASLKEELLGGRPSDGKDGMKSGG